MVLFLVPAFADSATLTFRDVTKDSGIRFKFKTDIRHGRMIATMGGAVAAADFDGDGFLDLYFSGSVGRASHPEKGPCGALYRNRQDGTFEDVTARAGIRSCGWQMGATWVDLDSDGRPDLVTTGLDSTRVWRNNGDGTFTDVTKRVAIDTGRQFTIGAAAGDFDLDGRVDLYLVGYLETTPEKELSFPQFQIRLPEDYPGEKSHLFRQDPDGRFDDVTASAGVANEGGRGTGAVFFDFDGDGASDLYVANDRESNRLYRNSGGERFEDVTEETGSGAREGKPRAGMGIAVGDPFGEGFPSLFVTNFSGEPSTLYRNRSGALFDDATESSNVGRGSWPYVQWGTHFADFDNDGDPDLYAVSGHLVPRFLAALAGLFNRRHLRDMFQGETAYREPMTIWRNAGSGRFEDATKDAGDLAKVRVCARGSAVGDFDGDGRLDLAVAAISGGARVFRNESRPAGHSIEILPVAGLARRTCLGTKIRVFAGGKSQIQEFIVAPSYASGSWVPLHFGLGAADRAEKIEVIPPGAKLASREYQNVLADRFYRLQDERLTEMRTFSR